MTLPFLNPYGPIFSLIHLVHNHELTWDSSQIVILNCNLPFVLMFNFFFHILILGYLPDLFYELIWYKAYGFLTVFHQILGIPGNMTGEGEGIDWNLWFPNNFYPNTSALICFYTKSMHLITFEKSIRLKMFENCEWVFPENLERNPDLEKREWILCPL